MPEVEHKGWHRRGYLPHFDLPARVQHIVFRLRGSLPKHLLDLTAPPAEFRQLADELLDDGFGPLHLADPRIAELTTSALRYFDDQRYRLLAWCVMSNHVHAVIEQFDGWPLGGVVASWKTWTAREANRLLAREGPFWSKDYFDRYVRNEDDLARVIAYVENNPVKAGLCAHASEWRWSSAYQG